MFNLSYFQMRYPILADPGLQAVSNNLGLLGVQVPQVGGTLVTPSPSALGPVVGMSLLGGPFFQPGWMNTPTTSFSQVGLFPAPWSSISTPGKVSSVWDKIVPKAPLPVYTTARPLLVLRTPSAVSVCPAVPALAAGFLLPSQWLG